MKLGLKNIMLTTCTYNIHGMGRYNVTTHLHQLHNAKKTNKHLLAFEVWIYATPNFEIY